MALKNETTYVPDVPLELKRAIIDRVKERRSNMNDVVVEVLAERYDVLVELTGRRSSRLGDSRNLVLRMPPELQRKIKSKAADSGRTLQDEIKWTLANVFGTTPVASRVRRRTRRTGDASRPVRRTTVDIDAEALDRARQALGTRGLKETVNAALRQVGREDALARAGQRIRDGRIPGPTPEELADMRKPRAF
jgi:Arc/MetJ family transcription regulator